MQVTFPRRFRSLWRDEQGIVLAATLLILFLLMGVATLATFSGYTNLLTSTNLRLSTNAGTQADSAVNEALYRLALPEGKAGSIVPDLNNPNWKLDIMFGSASTGQVQSIQPSSDWPSAQKPGVPAATLQFKKDASGNVIFYNRNIQAPNPPFLALQLPIPLLNTLVGGTYQVLCIIGVGGIVGLCPSASSLPDPGYPVIQIRATGFDDRGAERDLLVEAVRTLLFSPPAPLASGVDVKLNGSGFIDGVNHDHRISIAAGAIYGDDDSETTDNATLLNLIKDSPDDNKLEPLLDLTHAVANTTLTLLLYPAYTSYPRLFNRQISATDLTPAWVGIGRLLGGVGGLWTGDNKGYASAIALSKDPVVLQDQPPSGNVWKKGVFTWRVNNGSTNLGATTPAANTTRECSLPIGSITLVCRPAVLATFPSFQTYLGLDDAAYQDLLAKPDTTKADLDAGKPPVGFTYINGDYTFNNSTASPGTNDFGLLYVTGTLTINGNQTFKGLIFVDGSVKVSGNPTILGAIMVRGATHITVGTGNMTLLYSRKAADLGLQNVRTWRVLTWADTAVTQ